jgi:hypothetical protein
LGEFETEVKTILRCSSLAWQWSINEKTIGQTSCDTVSLNDNNISRLYVAGIEIMDLEKGQYSI